MPYTDLLKSLKGERLSSVLVPDGTLISASATPHGGGGGGGILNNGMVKRERETSSSGLSS